MAEATQYSTDNVPAQKATSTGDAVIIKRATLNYTVFVAVLFVAAYIAGWAMATSSGEAAGAVRRAVQEAVSTTVAGLPTNQSQAAALPPTQTPVERFKVAVEGNPTIGPDTAPVTIIEFSDFQCPFCKRFHDGTLQALLKKYEGKIRFAYRDFPISAIHPFAQGAAEAAECAHAQNKFWEYHDLLFQNQDRLTRDDLIGYARQLNLDAKAFQDCYDTGQYAQEVQADLQVGQTLGITGTPTFFINGRLLVGAQPLSAFSTIIDAELAAAGKAAGPAS